MNQATGRPLNLGGTKDEIKTYNSLKINKD